MCLRALIAAEVIVDLVAEGNDPEELAPLAQPALFAGVQLFHNASQFGKIGAHAFILVHGPDRAVQKAIGMLRRGKDFLAAHIGELVDLLAKFGRIGIGRDQIGDEAFDFGGQLVFHLVLNGDQTGSFLDRDFRHGIGRRQFEIVFRGGLCLVGRHSCGLSAS